MFDVTEPYPGIRPFHQEDAGAYVGREELIEDIIRRLQRDHLVTIAGPSGSGKSSLVRAGLLPRISATALSPHRIIAMRPGNSPLRHLIDALAGGVLSESPLDHDLTPDRGLQLVRQTLERRNGTILLVVDQFEEIFRACVRPDSFDQCVGFVAALAGIKVQVLPAMYAVLTVRTELLGDCGRLAGLTELLNGSIHLLPPLSHNERLSAITQPLALMGGCCERGFAEQLATDCEDLYPDDLVLMQHVLGRMWARAQAIQPDRPTLTRSGYEAVGGLKRSLDLHAEEVLAALPAEGQALAPRLFRSLTARLPGAVYIRRPDRLEHLAQLLSVDIAQASRVLEPFYEAGLVVLSDIVELKHEALVRCWNRLRQWTDSEAEAGDMYSHLLWSAERYREGTANLLRNPLLDQALSWADREQPSAVWAERYGGQFDLVMGYLSDSAKATHQGATEAGSARRQHGQGVFLCYRRDDSAGDARFIADALTRRFGPRQVFMDIDGIAPGSNFEEALRASLSSSAVALVLIGIHWLDVKDEEGRRRLDNSGDYVRREIRDALNSRLTVIPVLIGRAVMPEEHELPPDIRPLAKLQHVILKHETFRADLSTLTERLTASVQPLGVAVRLKDGLTKALQWTRLPPRH